MTRIANSLRRANTWQVWRWLVLSVASVLAVQKMLRTGTDFGIVLAAAREMSEGGVDLFRLRDDTGAYPYPHWVLLPLLPFLWLPETALRVLYGLGLGWASLWIVSDVRRGVGRYVALRPWHWLLFVALFVRWFSSNYTNGQLSLWVAALVIRGVVTLDQQPTSSRPGVLLGAAAAAKLTPLAFLPALPLAGAFRAAGAMLLSLLLAVFVLPLPFVGWDEHLRHLRDFYAAMIEPLFHSGAGGDAEIWGGPNASIDGTLRTVLQDGRVDPATEPRSHWFDLDPSTVSVVKACWSAVLLGLCAQAFFRVRRCREQLLIQGSVVCIATALFSPLTRTYHCAILLLVGMLFIVDGAKGGLRRGLWLLASVGFAFSMTLRQRGLLGHDLWYAFDRIGLMHLAIVSVLALLATRSPFTAEPGAGRPHDVVTG